MTEKLAYVELMKFLESEAGQLFIESRGEIKCLCGKHLTNKEEVDQHIADMRTYYNQPWNN